MADTLTAFEKNRTQAV